jgi:1-acyl-sn-glycerol-3-phosphate acyltransferase
VLFPLARALRLWFRPVVRGLERVPADRPVVYAGKHPRGWLYLETILMGGVVFGDGRRPPFRTLEARGTLPQRAPLLGWIRRHVGAIEATAGAARAALARGESVLVFPGGAREARGPAGRVRWSGRRGFARIAAAAQVPIVPFAIRGADRQHPLRLPLGRHTLWLPPLPLPARLELRFGAPIPPPDPGDRAGVAAAAARAAREAQALLDGREDGAPEPLLPPVGSGRRRYRAYGAAAEALFRWHRTRVEGAAPAGPCIYVALHGAGYLVTDLVVAGYALCWRDHLRRGGPRVPLRIAAARSRIERALPGLASVKRDLGLVEPSEERCLAALRAGEQLLVTPGGLREARPRREFYRLRWEGRRGFARLALRAGVPVVPLAVVGGAEAYPGLRAGPLSLWSPLPLPSRLDVVVGEPIAVAADAGAGEDGAAVARLHALALARTQALYDAVLARRRGAGRPLGGRGMGGA